MPQKILREGTINSINCMHLNGFPSMISGNILQLPSSQVTPWRNGSASDSRSEGCVFESRRGQQ